MLTIFFPLRWQQKFQNTFAAESLHICHESPKGTRKIIWVFLKFWVCEFYQFFFQKFQTDRCTIWRNQKPQLFGNIVELNVVVKFGTRMQYFNICSIQCHFGIIRCTASFPKTLFLKHYVFYKWQPKFSNFFWIIYPILLTNLRLGFIKQVWKLTF